MEHVGVSYYKKGNLPSQNCFKVYTTIVYFWETFHFIFAPKKMQAAVVARETTLNL